MTQYIATFFSHFGAVRFERLCKARGWQAQLRPVPRSLSSSCGTCVYFTAETLGELHELRTPELEQLVRVEAGYTVLYKAED
jgi:hypothetical protein